MPPSGYETSPRFGHDESSARGEAAQVKARGFGWNGFPAMRRHLDRLDLYARAIVPGLVALFLVSALLNVLVGLVHGYRASVPALDWDEIEYWSMSSAILHGHWDPGERRTIVFPAIIAGLRLIDGNFRFVQAGLSVLAALSAPLLACVVRRLGGSPRLALLAGMLMALWPAQMFLASSLYSETVALPFFLLFLLALPLGSRAIAADRSNAANGRAKNWQANWRGGACMAGLALGVCAQVRPMYLLFLPFALIIPFLEELSPRRAARTALLVAAGFAVVVLPWSLWMSSRHGRMIILTANGGETLAGGLNPRLVGMADTTKQLSNRTTWVGPGKWLAPPATGYLTPAEVRLPYGQMSRLLEQRSLAWIAGHPLAAMWIELYKLAYMWGLYPWREDDLLRLLAGNLPILALLGFALVLTVRKAIPWLPLARLWTVPLFTSGVALISWGSWRFRQPADAALLALCVVAMASHRRAGPTGR